MVKKFIKTYIWLLLIPTAYIPYRILNEQVLVKKYGCGCPQVTLGENGEYITLNNAFNANTITANVGSILALVSLALIMIFYIICFKPKGLKGWALFALSTAVCALILFALASFFYYSQQWD